MHQEDLLVRLLSEKCLDEGLFLRVEIVVGCVEQQRQREAFHADPLHTMVMPQPNTLLQYEE